MSGRGDWHGKFITFLIGLVLGLGLVAQTRATVTGDGNVSDSSGDSRVPTLAVGADGTRYVAWEEDGQQVYVAVEGVAGWLVEPLSAGMTPALAAVATDTAHLVYTADDGTGNLEVYYSRWSGDAWSPPRNVSLTSGASTTPAIAVAADGSPHIVWTDLTAGEPTVYYGTLEGTTPILNARGTAPALAVQGEEIHLVWQEPDGTTGLGEVFYLHGNGATWSFAENLSNSPGVASTAPDVAITPDGTLYVVWNEGGKVVLRSGRSLNFSPPRELYGGTDGGQVRIASGGMGEIAVVWSEAGRRVRLVERLANGAWTAPRTVAEGDAGYGGVALRYGPQGKIHVAWSAPGRDGAADIYIRALSPMTAPAEHRVLLPLVTK